MPLVVVETADEDLPCSEMWVDPIELGEQFVTATSDQLNAAALDATWLLWMLTGQRFHGDQCWVEDYQSFRGGSGCKLDLDKFPVTVITSVSSVDFCSDTVGVTGIGDELSSWCHLGSGIVSTCGSSGYEDFRIQAACGCSGSDGIIRVRYQVGNNIPAGAGRAAKKLAEQYMIAVTGGKNCQLPERITTVTRNGTSWTVLDPQDFLDQGRTGIGSVDQWIAGANQRGWVKVIDPNRRPPLLRSTLVGCGSDCAVAGVIADGAVILDGNG